MTLGRKLVFIKNLCNYEFTKLDEDDNRFPTNFQPEKEEKKKEEREREKRRKKKKIILNEGFSFS
jgi:hypothetical protein